MAKILAIESSGLVASVALATEEKIIGDYSVNLKLTHSQTLLPMVDELMKRTETDLSEIDAIAVSKGPGSFTGLRIGSSTAKGLGLVIKKPIVEVPTTETIAASVFGVSGVICPIMDARRGQVYTGVYGNDEKGFSTFVEQRACGITEIIDILNGMGEKVLFLGDGVPVFRDVICERMTVPVRFAPINMNMQNASGLAVRALDMYARGIYVTAAGHVPDYLRLSQAERERNERS